MPTTDSTGTETTSGAVTVTARTIWSAGSPSSGAIPMGDTFLWLYEDAGRGLALLRGRGVADVLDAAHVRDHACWSVAAKGYVLPLPAVADVCAVADVLGVPYRVKAVDG